MILYIISQCYAVIKMLCNFVFKLFGTYISAAIKQKYLLQQ